MFAAPTEGILKDFTEFSDTGFADHEQSPPHQRTHAAEHYAKLIDRIRDDTEGSDMRAVYPSPPGASMLERLLPNSRSRVEVRRWRVLGKPINPEGRPRLIFCRSIRREKSGSSSAGLAFSWILAQGSHRRRRMLLRSNIYGRSKRVGLRRDAQTIFAAPSNMKCRKKIDPIARLIEAMLDFALITGLLAAVVFLVVSTTARLVF